MRLQIDGEVSNSVELSLSDLEAIDPAWQVPDVSRIDPKRKGKAVKLAGLLKLAQARPDAKYLTLHASADDFHASIPLASVADRGLLIYEIDGQPVPNTSVCFHVCDELCMPIKSWLRTNTGLVCRICAAGGA